MDIFIAMHFRTQSFVPPGSVCVRVCVWQDEHMLKHVFCACILVLAESLDTHTLTPHGAGPLTMEAQPRAHT